MKYILASASLRRIKLLKQIGIQFKSIPSKINEKSFCSCPFMGKATTIAKTLAIAKALDVSKKFDTGIIIGVDTIVVIRDEILGKPKSFKEAASILKKLSGKTHKVITGFAIVDAKNGRKLVDSVSTFVTFRKLSNQEIIDYVKTKEPMDKAGAYGIQGNGGCFVKKLTGCYFNVVGLPLAKLSEVLNKFVQ